MKKIIDIDGMQKMLLPLTKDDMADETIDDWYSSSKSDKRKELDDVINRFRHTVTNPST